MWVGGCVFCSRLFWFRGSFFVKFDVRFDFIGYINDYTIIDIGFRYWCCFRFLGLRGIRVREVIFGFKRFGFRGFCLVRFWKVL